MFAVNEPPPAVDVTTMEYTPAAVPVAGLTEGAAVPCGVPPQASKPPTITNKKASNSCGARCGTRPVRALKPKQRRITSPARQSASRQRQGSPGILKAGAAECATVTIESITLVAPLPAGIVAEGEND